MEGNRDNGLVWSDLEVRRGLEGTKLSVSWFGMVCRLIRRGFPFNLYKRGLKTRSHQSKPPPMGDTNLVSRIVAMDVKGLAPLIPATGGGKGYSKHRTHFSKSDANMLPALEHIAVSGGNPRFGDRFFRGWGRI